MGESCVEAFTLIHKMFNVTLQERNKAYQINQRLNQRHLKLKEQLKTLSAKFNKDDTELECQRKDNEKLRCCRQELEEELQTLETEFKEKGHEQEALDNHCKELVEKKNDLEANCKMIEYLEQENEDLKEHLHLWEKSFKKVGRDGEAEINRLLVEVQNLRKKNAILLEKKTRLQESYHTQCKNHSELTQDLDRTSTRVVEMDAELTATRCRVEDLRNELYCVEKEIIEIQKRQALEEKMKRKKIAENLKHMGIDWQNRKDTEKLRKRQAEIDKLKQQHRELEALIKRREAQGALYGRRDFTDGEMSQSCTSFNYKKPRPRTPRHKSNPCMSQSCSKSRTHSLKYPRGNRSKCRHHSKKSLYDSDGLAPRNRQNAGRKGLHYSNKRR